MSDIQGKVIAITGASSGIGAATAQLLAAAGAKVVIGARRAARLDVVGRSILAAGGEVVQAVIDVRKRADLTHFIEVAKEHYGRLDVLVSAAGIGPISPIDELRVEDWDDMIDVNLKGVLYGIAAALPLFRGQKSGHFVNVVSTSGLKIVPMQAIYAGTKNAVRTISEGLRQEAGPHLRVTVVSPGFVKTNFADSMTSPTVKAQTNAAMRSIAIPPEAIARAIAFAIGEPPEVDVGDIVVRPTAQG